MKRYDLIVVGAGPAGLSAAIQAARYGAKTAVFDENASPGGQLFKQIHKFFGSKEHHAKVRGFNIGKELLQEASDAGVTVHLNAVVMGIYDNKEILVNMEGKTAHYKGDTIIVAAGARENMIPFPGWTLPGVMGAGAAQTLMNLHGVQPGQQVLMVGSGNVGLVVGYQLIQAGVKLAAVIDAAPRVGGYGVHAAKLARMGVPFYVSHTVLRAEGSDRVTGAVIAQVDERFRPIPGTEKHFDVDTICLAVGLNPMTELAWMAGCKFDDIPQFGGHVPLHDGNMETTVEGINVAGDITGVEEASTAMEEGNLAGVAAAEALGYLDGPCAAGKKQEIRRRMDMLRSGAFGEGRRRNKEKQLADMEAYRMNQEKEAGEDGE